MAEDERNLEGKVVDGFQILERFAGGGFSEVHMAKHLRTNRHCAVKIINLASMNQTAFNGMMREISVFMQVSHPNIVSCFRLSLVNKLLLFFMEYIPNGTLLQFIQRRRKYDESEVRRIFVQLFAVLRYIHTHHFLVHRDLKLENVLLDVHNNVKLIDFGLSGTFYNTILKTFVGSPGYTPPEVVAGNEYGEKCDVWSLGVCLYALVAARLPFTLQSKDLKKLLAECETLTKPENMSPACWDLVRRMLAVRPGDRPTLDQLNQHPWITGLPPIDSKITPVPIIFYRVKGFEDIVKFKRKARLVLNEEVASNAAKLCDVDKDELVRELEAGLITERTTTYYLLTSPIAEKPTSSASLDRLPPLLKADGKDRRRIAFAERRAKLLHGEQVRVRSGAAGGPPRNKKPLGKPPGKTKSLGVGPQAAFPKPPRR